MGLFTCDVFLQVTLPDFFLADQLTSQVHTMPCAIGLTIQHLFLLPEIIKIIIIMSVLQLQAFRSLEFYVCYYGWGDYKLRQNTCSTNDVFKAFSFIVVAIPYWCRLFQVRALSNELIVNWTWSHSSDCHFNWKLNMKKHWFISTLPCSLQKEKENKKRFSETFISPFILAIVTERMILQFFSACEGCLRRRIRCKDTMGWNISRPWLLLVWGQLTALTGGK